MNALGGFVYKVQVFEPHPVYSIIYTSKVRINNNVSLY